MAGPVRANLHVETSGDHYAVHTMDCPVAEARVDPVSRSRRCCAYSPTAGTRTCPFLYGLANERGVQRDNMANLAVDAAWKLREHTPIIALCLRKESKGIQEGV
jgi:hypothetical protein